MIKRWFNRLFDYVTDAQGWRGYRFDPVPWYYVARYDGTWSMQAWVRTPDPFTQTFRFDGTTATLYINGRKVSTFP